METRDEDCRAVPISERAQNLRDHYDKISTEAGEWCNQIPVAIDLWEAQRATPEPEAEPVVVKKDSVSLPLIQFMEAMQEDGRKFDQDDLADWSYRIARSMLYREPSVVEREEHPGLTVGKDGDIWTLCPDCPVWDTPQMDKDHRAMEDLRSLGYVWNIYGCGIDGESFSLYGYKEGEFFPGSKLPVFPDPADAINSEPKEEAKE